MLTQAGAEIFNTVYRIAYHLKKLWIISYSEFSYAGGRDLGSLKGFSFKLEFILAWCKKKINQKGPGQGHRDQERAEEEKLNFCLWKERD